MRERSATPVQSAVSEDRAKTTKCFVFGGNRTKELSIRALRTARSASEKGEPFGTEATEFATRRYVQRDTEIEVETVDKSGGFISVLWLNQSENAAIALVQEGSAMVHSYSVDKLSWSK